MTFGENSGPEQDRAAINLAIAEATRDSVDKICSEIIDISFELLKSKLREDEEKIELYHQSNALYDHEIMIYVRPDTLHAPMYEDEPTPTLTLLLERRAPEDGSTDDASGDRIRVYLPVAREHVYPEALADEDKPTEMYFEFIPNPLKHEASTRYIVQRNPNDAPQYRYGIYAYESAADTGEQVIHDAMSDTVLHDSLLDRIPGDIEMAGWLLRRLGNFDVMHQADIGLKRDNSSDTTRLSE